MFHAIRLASNVEYPLPVAGPARWRAGAEPVRVPLPDVPADHIIAASFASGEAHGPFAFALDTHDGRAQTAWFGPFGGGQGARGAETAGRNAAGNAGCAVAVPVDYFHTRTALSRPVLHLCCAAPEPRAYLLSVSIRPGVTEPPRQLPADTPLAPASCLSQTTLDDGDKARACSPTATAMALGIGDAAGLRALVEQARHRATGLLGVWPQNVWAAARHGRLGAVELIADWDTVRRALGVPQGSAALVASVRFGRGGLPGSPLAGSAGHLVTVRGIERGVVVAHDPAAPPGCVSRRYDAGRFGEAWMRHRGAAYVFARAGEPT